LLAMTEDDQPHNIRARPMLMLLAIYGLRRGEVNRLRLEDFDWEHEAFRVVSSKTGRVRTYPLVRSVGNAILRYLCHAHAPHSMLWPQDPHARANIDRWMDAQQTVLNRPMGVVFWGLVRTPADQRDPAAIAQGVADAAKAYGMIEPLLARHAYIAGPDFTLADIPWGVHAHRWFNMDFERPALPHLRAWYDRLCERPAYKQHIVACPVV